MNARGQLLRLLIVLLALSFFQVVVIQPTGSVDPVLAFFLVFVADLVAYGVAYLTGGGVSGLLLRLLLASAAESVLFVYFLQPASSVFSSFDATFLAVFIINVAGLVVAYFLSKEKKR